MATESPLKLMKNAFYFTVKAVFVLKIFKFLPWFFGHIEKRLDQKDKANFKILTPQSGQQTITVHILPNMSRNKGNQTINFGQLIKHNIRNIFLEKLVKNKI